MYDFENKDKIPFNELTGDQMKMVVVGLSLGYTELLIDGNTNTWCADEAGHCDIFYSVLRVKSAPYTLEDALADIDMCSNAPFLDEAIVECKKITVKLAASLKGK